VDGEERFYSGTEVAIMRAVAKLSGKDLLLLLLYAPTDSGEAEGIRGRTRLVKMVFLFWKELYDDFRFDREIDRRKLPRFYAWYYGPFSRDVYADIDFFVHIGFIQTKQCSGVEALREEAEEYLFWESEMDIAEAVPSVSEYSEEVIELTERGVGYVRDARLWSRLSSRQQRALSGFRCRLAHAPLFAILKYVYEKYPEMTRSSVIKDEVAGYRY